MSNNSILALHALKLPAISAPMFLISNPEMAQQVCKHGMIGSFPLANARPISEVERWMNSMRRGYKNTDMAPYAINMIVHSSYERFHEELTLLQRFCPPIVITSLGDPGRVLDTVHNYGGVVWSDVNSIEFAKKAAAKGVDGLILVCRGAGGHTGTLDPENFINTVKEFFDGTLILAGGIMNGNDIANAIDLGADLAYMGTRFLAANESNASPEYKKMCVDSDAEDLILTDKVTGVPAYFLKQSLENAGFEVEGKTQKEFNTEFISSNTGDHKAWRDIWSAGSGVGEIVKLESVESIITKLKAEYEQITQGHKNGGNAE